MDGGALNEPGPGVLARLVATWSRPREASRPEIAQAGEGRLLAYALVGSLVHTLAALAAGALAPSPQAAADPGGWAAATLAGGVFVRPLGLYAVAGLLGLGARLAGGVGGWRESRAATFWTGLAASPAALLFATAGAAAEAAGLRGAAGAGGAAGALLWAILLAPALAEAHGFRRSWPALAAMGVLGLALSALALT